MGILNLALLNLKRMLKQKTAIIAMFIMPTAVVLIVLAIIGGKTGETELIPKIAVVNNDKGIEGKMLVDSLKINNRYKIYETNIEDANKRIKTNMGDAAVVIPNSFTEDINNKKTPVVEILRLSENNTSYGAIKDINDLINQRLISKNLGGFVKGKGVNLNSSDLEIQRRVEEYLKNPGMKVSIEALRNDGKKSIGDTLSIQFVIIFLMTSLTFVVSDIFELKQNRTLRRSLSTPNKNTRIVGGILIAMFVLFILQAFLLISSTMLIFKVYWGKSLLALSIICILLILVAISLGILLSRWVKNTAQLPLISNLIVVPASLISGCMIPKEYLPDIFDKIAYFIPQKWALDALTNIALKDCGVIDILPQAGILLLFAIAFFTAGARSLREIVK